MIRFSIVEIVQKVGRNQYSVYNSGKSAADEPPKFGPLPLIVLRPPAGTALVYGGRVPHAGMPVVSGQRAILIGSFSLRRADLQSMEFD